MARPELDNGYFRIANEIAEALCRMNLSAYQSRILWALWRSTYGWNKKAWTVSIGRFQRLTGMKRRHVQRTLNKLIERNIIIKVAVTGYKNLYGFQKDYERWV